MMILNGARIEMTASEVDAFSAATFAPWTPRTIAEFNAMCDLGSARHLVDNTGGKGFMFALEAEGMKFGENGEVNFPMDQRKMAYLKAHGTWPTEEEVRAFEADGPVVPRLSVVPRS